MYLLPGIKIMQEKHIQPPDIQASIQEHTINIQQLQQEISKVIVGQQDCINFIIIGMLCNGHILLEGVPGVAKTTIIKTIAQALNLSFSRIQFTPDLLPADLTGNLIYNPKTQDFITKKGPLFAHLVLADEINRAPAKVQSALLEAMQEQQVTLGSDTLLLPTPFLVFATQNPIEQEGTYRLPEAAVDRFMLKLILTYPSPEQEREIVLKNTQKTIVNPVMTVDDIAQAQKLVQQIYVDPKILDYIINIIQATRAPEQHGLNAIKPYLEYGLSPRATITLYNTARAHAFLQSRYFVTPDDVKAVAPAALAHRLGLTYHADAQNITGRHIIKKIINTITSP